MITGGTRGIGLGIARQLAKEGYHLVINGVRPERAISAVLEELRALGSSCVYSQANIGDSEDRQALLQCAKSEFGRCNVLVNNAGAFNMSRRNSADGIEMTFALNHLSYFLLTNLLLDVLTASAPARVVMS